MKPEIKTSIHNRFDIYKTNVKTGKTEQVAFAENIVLDQMWPRLINRLDYFANIHFGTGSGTLSAGRTSLFTHLGTKAAVNDVLLRTLPTASWRRKIILNPEDYVGAVLSEIGIAYDSAAAHLVTHAMLKDMNGNQVAITKTAADLLTVYATVYITFSTTDDSLQICGLPDNNPLMNYLVGGHVISNCYFFTGECKFPSNPKTIGVMANTILGKTVAITWTVDIANKKMTTSTPRFSVSESNGNIREIVFGETEAYPIFRILLPAGSIYNGLALSGVPIGTGDGTKRKFNTPSKSIRNTSMAVYIDGVLSTDYTLDRGTDGLAVMMRQFLLNSYEGANGCKISKNQKVAAMITSLAPYMCSFDIVSEGTLVKRPDPTTLSSSPLGVSLSEDGSVMAIAHFGTPYITTYDWTAGAWVKRADPAILPTGSAYGCAMSDDGNILAVAHATSPYITTYDWTAGAWVKRADPAILPTGSAYGCELSADGSILAVAHEASPYITTYDWTAGAWVKRADPAILPTGSAYGCAMSANNTLLTVAHAVSPYITTYDWTAGEWAKRTNPEVLPKTTGKKCCLSADGTIMILSEDANLNSGEVFCWYLWTDGAWVKQNVTTAGWMAYAGSMANEVAMTQDGKMALITLNSDYGGWGAHLIDMGAVSTRICFNSAPASGAVITADYIVDGIHKTEQRVIDLNASITFGEPV